MLTRLRLNRVSWLALLVVALGVLLSSGAQATVSYTPPLGSGNQSYDGSLGMGFDTIAAINVTSLGVFDSGQDGIPSGTTLHAAIFDRDTQAIVVGTIDFPSGSGTLVGPSLFLPVPGGPAVLPSGGHYTIVAWGFAPSEQNGNIYFGGSAASFDSGGGLISEGLATYSDVGTGGAYPNLGPASFYVPGQFWAGTFEYNAVPLPPSVLLLGSGLLGLGLLRRKWSLKK